MNKYTIYANGPIKLPSGVTVGDEFRVAGKVRVTAISEDLVDTTGFPSRSSSPEMLPGGRSYTLIVSDLKEVPGDGAAA